MTSLIIDVETHIHNEVNLCVQQLSKQTDFAANEKMANVIASLDTTWEQLFKAIVKYFIGKKSIHVENSEKKNKKKNI